MIKNVFNAIHNSTEAASLKGTAGKGAGKVTPGFFGKMLMSFQNQDGEAAPSGNQEQAAGTTNSALQVDSEAEGKKQTLHFGVMPEQLSSTIKDSGEMQVPTSEHEETPALSIGIVKVEEGADNAGASETDQDIEKEMIAGDSNTSISKVEEPIGKATEESQGLDAAVSAEPQHTESTDENEVLKAQKTQTINAEAVQTKTDVDLHAQPGNARGDSKTQLTENSAPLVVSAETESLEQTAASTKTTPLAEVEIEEGKVQISGKNAVDTKLNSTTSGDDADPEIPATDKTNSQSSSELLNAEGKIGQAGQGIREVQGKESAVTTKATVPETEQPRRSVPNENPVQQVQRAEKEISLGDDVKDSLKAQVKMQTQQSQEEREKRYDLSRSSADGNSISGERLQPIAGAGTSGGQQQNMSFSGQPNWLKFQTAGPQNSSFSEDQQAFLNEQIANATSETETDEAEKMGINMSRLSDVPIANVTLRRSILPGLTTSVQRAAAGGKENTQVWQRHSFEMEDGNRIELSTRNVDGVLQVKIASASPELSKLMQQYGQEISDHLEKECEIQVDLQFDEGNDMSGFFGGTDSQGKGRSGNQFSSGSGAKAEQKSQEHLQHAVRNFGYNRMEWTA
ncbi:MAG: hypothetical protein CL666_01650 [Balneola sp.]|nr:hypothetical protein [Balneola sp.]|tara:strand:+ start:57919 stop:59793 length:1875 start_codon:yes stop_codon:yes gene_type:complete